MATPDADLVSAALSGDGAAFGALLERHYDRIHRIAWRILGDRAEAEDCAQDVCMTLSRRLRGFGGRAAFTTWLHSVVVNAARDRLRAGATRQRKWAEWGDVEALRRDEADAARREAEWLSAAMATLGGDLRETLALVLEDDMTQREVAAALGIPEGTVAWRMSEVKRRLRQAASKEAAQ